MRKETKQIYQKDRVFVKDRGIWLRFIKMLFKSRLPILWIAAYFALSMFITNLGVSVTEYTAQMFAGNLSFEGVILPFLLYSAFNIVTSAISFALSYLCYARIDRNLRRMVWDKITRLPLSYFDKHPPKELISRITDDTGSISGLIIQTIVPFFTGLYSLYVLFKRIGTYDQSLMWTLFAVVPFVVVTGFIMGKMRFGINDTFTRRTAAMVRELSEKVTNVPLVKSFAKEEQEIQTGRAYMTALYKTARKASWIGQLSSPVYTMVSVLQVIVIVLVGRNFYMTGALDLTQWIAYLAFATQIANSLQGYAGYWTSFKSSQGATRRVTYIMDERNEDEGPDRSAEDMSGGFTFHDVTFAYEETPVLRHINLHIPEGKATAFVGLSGGGKTTMLNLLERFYTPQEGYITVGDEDISSYNMKSYRENIAYMTQECVLFSGTIRENILYGFQREVSQEELDAACKAANAYDFIMEFPEGYETQVGEAGGKLSGGQKQRLAIARTILKAPKYLFMDEATGAMDAKAKEDIWVGLRALMEGKTTVIVAHDYQTAKNAEYIVVVANGMIEDFGTKEEVYERNDFYRQLADQEEVESNG